MEQLVHKPVDKEAFVAALSQTAANELERQGISDDDASIDLRELITAVETFALAMHLTIIDEILKPGNDLSLTVSVTEFVTTSRSSINEKFSQEVMKRISQTMANG